VLVSDAVRVLQKECTQGLSFAAGGAAGTSSSFSEETFSFFCCKWTET
jgi:hypothetical protein